MQGVKYLEMHGSVYHLIPPITDQNGEPIYAQIYMIDGEEAQAARRQDVLHTNHGLNIGQLRMLQNIINTYNPYARTFSTLVNTEWFRGQSTDQLQQFCLSFAAGVRSYNRDRPPVAVELGMVIANDEPRMPGELRVQLIGRNAQPQSIPWSSPFYDTLRFVLFHPRGERGWGSNMSVSHTISPRDYEIMYVTLPI